MKRWWAKSENRKRQSEAHKGFKVSKETKRKISKTLTGKPLTEEHKRRMSESRNRAVVYRVEGDCHICTSHAPTGTGGYPVVTRKGIVRTVPRWAWETSRGKKIPKGMLICHTCDNPRCINPRHLYLGTHLDNARDRVEHGRQVKGEMMHTAKLIPTKVREIRGKVTLGIQSLCAIGREYGVTYETIRAIRDRRTWRHVK